MAEKTDLGRAWIGLILLSTVTSLPELGTGISAITIFSSADLAVGSVWGSCVFNLMLVGVLDFLSKGGSIFERVGKGQIIACGFGILLSGIGIWGIVLGQYTSGFQMIRIGVYTPMIFIIFIVSLKLIFNFEQRRRSAPDGSGAERQGKKYADMSRNRVLAKIALHGGVVIGAGVWLAYAGREIAQVTGWGETFVGSLLIGVSASLPEIVASIAALKISAPNLAMANLLGSNICNVAVLGIEDVVYLKGPLLSNVSSYHLLSGTTAIAMTSICLVAMAYPARKTAGKHFSWIGIILSALFLINAYLLFVFSGTGR